MKLRLKKEKSLFMRYLFLSNNLSLVTNRKRLHFNCFVADGANALE